jgi:hypothetical protein
MTLAAILAIINGAIGLTQAGTQIYEFLQGVKGRVATAQAAGTELTADDWAFILSALAAAHAAVQGTK